MWSKIWQTSNNQTLRLLSLGIQALENKWKTDLQYQRESVWVLTFKEKCPHMYIYPVIIQTMKWYFIKHVSDTLFYGRWMEDHDVLKSHTIV